jgi:hypothetical protein
VLRAATSQRAELAEILFATNAYDKGHTAAVNNVIGKPVKSAVLVENMTDSRYNTVIVDLVEPCFVSYSVFST